MSFPYWFAVAAVALLPLAATAQQAPQQSDPANANAAMLASAYVSAFTNYQATAAEPASPDKVWRQANDDVQAQDAHAVHMQAPGASGGPPMPKADAHPGHSGHNNKGK